MPLSKILRIVILVAIVLYGASILVGVAAWLHYWIYGSLNPDKVKPLENWSLTLGVTSWGIRLASSIEALSISIVTRFRWIDYNRGKTAVGLFGFIVLLHTLGGLWLIVSNSVMDLMGFAIDLIILVPLGIAWLLLRFQHA